MYRAMATVLVVTTDQRERERWARSLVAQGFAIAEAPVLVSALAELAAAELAAIVVDADAPDALLVLAALSNLYPLPPVVVVGAGGGPTVPSRVPAFRRVRGTVPPRQVAAEVAAEVERAIASCVDGAPQLPLRMCAVLEAKWTTRLVARPVRDEWAGATEPFGFDLT
jgi:CheY-like chemotaxis protein